MNFITKTKKFITIYKLEILIFFMFLLLHLPGLGHDLFNTDVWKWKARSYDFGSGIFNLNFDKTIQKYHPGVTLMWINTFAIKAYNFYHKVLLGSPAQDNNINNIFQLHFFQKFFIVIVISLTIASIFFVLRRLFGNKYASLSIFLLTFEPFYLALTRVVHLEGLMSTFMIASFVWCFYYLKHRHAKYLIITSLFTALAVLTKTSAIFMFLFIGLMLLIDTIDFKRKITLLIRSYFMYFAISILFFILFWPAMWVYPIKALETLYRGIVDIGVEGDHMQIFLGQRVADPGAIFYPIVIFARSSLYLLIGFTGYLFTRHEIKDKTKNKFILYLLIFTLFYLAELTLSSKKLDRYVLPAIMSVLLITSFFFENIIIKIKKEKFPEKFVYIIFALPAIYYYFYCWPNYFSYYSPVVGEFKMGIFVIEPKWMIGQREVIDFFEKYEGAGNYEKFQPGQSLDSLLYKPEIKNKLLIGFPEKYYTQIWPFIEEMGARATIEDLTPQAMETKFFVYPVYDDYSDEETRFKLEYVDSIMFQNFPLYNVYQRLNNDDSD